MSRGRAHHAHSLTGVRFGRIPVFDRWKREVESGDKVRHKCWAVGLAVFVMLFVAAQRTVVYGAQTAPAAPAVDRPTQVRAVLDRYCVTCHNPTQKAGNLTLDTADVARVADHRDLWEKVVRKLRVGAMPPAGARRPVAADYELVASYIESALDRAAAASPNPGRAAVARLNRAEYTNAVRDLLALDIDGRSLLPADDSGYGFDNIADVLSTSPALLERYLSAAQKISRLAVGDRAVKPSIQTYTIQSVYRQDDRMGDDFAFGTRGGMAVRHYFPADGEYVLKIRLQRQANKDVGPIRGLAQRQDVEVRLDGVRLHQFSVGGPGSLKKAADSLEDIHDTNSELNSRNEENGLRCNVRGAACAHRRSGLGRGSAVAEHEAVPERAAQRLRHGELLHRRRAEGHAVRRRLHARSS